MAKNTNTPTDYYMLTVVALAAVAWLLFLFGALGCTRIAAKEPVEFGPQGLPLYTHLPAPRPGWTNECPFGGVEVFYKGNTTYVCYRAPRLTEDRVFLVTACKRGNVGPDEAVVCVNGVLYGPRGTSDLLYEFQPGFYLNAKTGYSCSFNVKPGCIVE